MGERDRDRTQARQALATDERPDGRLTAGEVVLVAETLIDPVSGTVTRAWPRSLTLRSRDVRVASS